MERKKKQPAPVAGLLMGSESDWETMQHAIPVLQAFEIPYEVRVLSAHRTPEEAAAYARAAHDRGLKALIVAAGGAAHLAGAVAGHTTLPVIGVPLKGWALDGLDALLSTVQMPSGVPVATVAIGKPGAVNAVLLAAQILALSDNRIHQKLLEHKETLKTNVRRANERFRSESG